MAEIWYKFHIHMMFYRPLLHSSFKRPLKGQFTQIDSLFTFPHFVPNPLCVYIYIYIKAAGSGQEENIPEITLCIRKQL